MIYYQITLYHFVSIIFFHTDSFLKVCIASLINVYLFDKSPISLLGTIAFTALSHSWQVLPERHFLQEVWPQGTNITGSFSSPIHE